MKKFKLVGGVSGANVTDFSSFLPSTNVKSPAYVEAERIRSSVQWRRVRESVLDRGRGLCEYCCKGAIEEVHHIKPLVSCPELAYSLDNLLGLCLRCHVRLHTRMSRGEDVERQIERKLKNNLEKYVR